MKKFSPKMASSFVDATLQWVNFYNFLHVAHRLVVNYQ
jgi:hypothetical protein